MQTSVEVTGETTLQAAARLSEFHPLCLNFASAKNPGGGFLSGSQAQEESLARSSGLYSDYMAYSPSVPIFRRDDGVLLETPFQASFVTAPAVNAGAVAQNEPQNVKFINSTLAARLDKLLWLARQHGHKTLVLGAWGCGVFGNEPPNIAGLFASAFGPDGLFHGSFERIVYAVYDSSSGQETKAAFERVLEPTPQQVAAPPDAGRAG